MLRIVTSGWAPQRTKPKSTYGAVPENRNDQSQDARYEVDYDIGVYVRGQNRQSICNGLSTFRGDPSGSISGRRNASIWTVRTAGLWVINSTYRIG